MLPLLKRTGGINWLSHEGQVNYAASRPGDETPGKSEVGTNGADLRLFNISFKYILAP